MSYLATFAAPQTVHIHMYCWDASAYYNEKAKHDDQLQET